MKKNFSASIVSPLLSMKNDIIHQNTDNVHSECDAMMAGAEENKESDSSPNSCIKKYREQAIF